MGHEGFGYLDTHGHHRVQGCHGVLEYHGDPVAPDLFHLLLRKGEEVASCKIDAAAPDDSRRRRNEAHDGQGRSGLSGAALPHKSEGLAG